MQNEPTQPLNAQQTQDALVWLDSVHRIADAERTKLEDIIRAWQQKYRDVSRKLEESDAENAALKSDLEEQCRLLGMGGEREAKLASELCKTKDERDIWHQHYRDEQNKTQKCKEAFIEQENELRKTKEDRDSFRSGMNQWQETAHQYAMENAQLREIVDGSHLGVIEELAQSKDALAWIDSEYKIADKERTKLKEENVNLLADLGKAAKLLAKLNQIRITKDSSVFTQENWDEFCRLYRNYSPEK